MAATYVRFSLDAATRETHERLHRRDDFEIIVLNLRRLARAEGPCTVGTGFFINEHNVTEACEGARLVKAYRQAHPRA
jgi:MoaA/NifB/PqqE/SkfB family radical SAM enzyme